jgi:3-phenylpropionate/trans-cinnamate dioxygenase ferredoxin reductase subunit
MNAADPLAPEATVVVVGASVGGLRAAESLRAGGFAGRLVLVGEETHPPYDRPPLSKQVLAGTWPPERVTIADPQKLRDLALDLRLGHRAGAFDAEARRVDLDDGSSISADAVVLATGASPRQLGGTEGNEGVLVLRTLDDSLALRSRVLEQGPGCRVVVIGAGFIGSEVASTCLDLGCAVTVLEGFDVPLLRALGPVIGAACGSLHTEAGVDLRTGVGVSAVLGPAEATGSPGPVGAAGRVELADGTSVAADVVVVGIGVAPATDWLAGSGLVLDNGVVCDEGLFAADGVVAIGDLASFPFHGLPTRIEHWQMASDMGRAAGHSLLAGRVAAVPFEPVPYFWSDLYKVKLQMLGHPDPEDEVVVVDGSLESHRFVALYGRAAQLTGALGIGRPRQLMSYRPLLAAGSSFEAALAREVG